MAGVAVLSSLLNRLIGRIAKSPGMIRSTVFCRQKYNTEALIYGWLRIAPLWTMLQ